MTMKDEMKRRRLKRRVEREGKEDGEREEKSRKIGVKSQPPYQEKLLFDLGGTQMFSQHPGGLSSSKAQLTVSLGKRAHTVKESSGSYLKPSLKMTNRGYQRGE